MKELLQWLAENKEIVVTALILPALALAEGIVMLTPTKTDDGFLERVGGMIRKALEYFGLPNRLKIQVPEDKK